ncbi:uncharacterized protein A4U43_C05F22400 [Asparagus officinalis]|uniref:PHD-type domain-containing protein n=1 Tax=Asparagus officinalis TaxID=4686 RepID=A0A5P1EUB1_ASPOF|nr:uncharacterized protein A4U43_C05F22400 [Asparagus officinalis]
MSVARSAGRSTAAITDSASCASWSGPGSRPRWPRCGKQRFQINTAAVPGIFSRERVVDVPERNQVYNYLGNASTTVSDPYSNIICSECQTAANEELLLLCDLCDSASHTYCVGLGATIPEGDWYCRECAKIRDEHARNQSDSDGCNQDSYDILRAIRAPRTPLELSQIPSQASQIPIRPSQTSAESSHTPSQASQMQAQSSQLPARSPQRPVQSSQTPISIFEIVADAVVSNSSQGFTSEVVVEHQTTQRASRGEQHVRTLRQCRNLQVHIRKIRENWNAFRSGSLTFSLSFSNNSSRDHNSRRKNRVNIGMSSEPDSISSVGKEHSVDVSSSSNVSHNTGFKDVSKAWKMMEIAKSMEGTGKRTVLNHSSPVCAKRNSISKDTINHNTSSFVSKHPNGLNGCTALFVDKQHKCLGHQKSCIEKEMGIMEHFNGWAIGVTQDSKESSHHKISRVSSQEGPSCQKKPTPLQNVLNCPSSASCAPSVQSSLPTNNPVSVVNSHDKKRSEVRSADKNYIRRDNMKCSAKVEIQYLVKLNLKLQSKDYRLDAETFKEVARVATHTILAACGLEHSKSSAKIISMPKCKHTEQLRELRKCKLMPDSCRECFYSYVKDVVSSIFLEKIGSKKRPC